jgi:hypothetical protein
MHGGQKIQYSSLKRSQTKEKSKSPNVHTPPILETPIVVNPKIPSLSFCASPIHSFTYSALTPSRPHALLAPNNPKLTAQSFSPITGVESETISQFRSGKGVSFRSTTFGGGRVGPPAPPPLPCTGAGWRRARARCCCVCAGTALEAKARFGVVDEADALDEPRRERTLGSVCGIWRARVLRVSSGRASACRTATSCM